MTSESLATVLAERVMGWTVGPDRFLTGAGVGHPGGSFSP